MTATGINKRLLRLPLVIILPLLYFFNNFMTKCKSVIQAAIHRIQGAGTPEVEEGGAGWEDGKIERCWLFTTNLCKYCLTSEAGYLLFMQGGGGGDWWVGWEGREWGFSLQN